jgi:hypothetical protein
MLTEAAVHDRSWVTQCALSRICGGCAESLGRPVAFSVRRRRSAATPSTCRRMHLACAEELRLTPGADPRWQLVTTAGFEFVRPARRPWTSSRGSSPTRRSGRVGAVEGRAL